MVNKKPKQKKIVLASGTFDLLHLGHVKFLEEAKRAGGEDSELIVVVATDKTVKQRKGVKPIMPEDQRRALVEALKMVNKSILGYEIFDMGKVIEKTKPNIIAVGYDQDSIEEEVKKTIKERGLKLQIARIGQFKKDELSSSSRIKRKIINI